MDMYTLLYLKQISNKDILCSIENSAQCHVAAWMGGELGENGYMYMYDEALHRSPETITTLLTGYTPVQNKKFKNKNNKK